ncbi:MAG: hypothetical protein ACTH29_08510 [Fusobacterium sp.]
MSAMLGPIHHWLYNKILFQESITQLILENQKDNWNKNLNDELVSNCGEIKNVPLEDVIDVSNIHQSLQNKIIIVEKRLAFVVTKLLENDNIKITDILNNLDLNYKLENTSTPKEIYNELEKIFLNGMPCDRVLALIEDSENKFVFTEKVNIHEQYWNSFSGDSKNYYLIKNKIIENLLKDTNFYYQVNDNENIIRRK